METKIICLIGASGSGKDTVAKELEKYGLHDIPSYTTRPPRQKDEWGHTFIASYDSIPNVDGLIIRSINKSDNLLIMSKEILFDNMIAYFNSYNSGHHYFATDEQVIRNKTNIYRVDPKGAEMVKDYYKDSNVEVITIYLQADERIRSDRLRRRLNERVYQTDRNIASTKEYREHVVDRITRDRDIFKTVKCDYVVDANGSVEGVVNNILEIAGVV